MATKSEHRRPPEGTSRGLHEQIDTHSPDETQINGFDEVICIYRNSLVNTELFIRDDNIITFIIML